MKAKVGFIMVLLVFIAFIPLMSGVTDSEWKLEKEEKSISLYTREVPDSKFKEAKGVTKATGTLKGVIQIMENFNRYSEWLFECKEAKLLRKQDDHQYYIYLIIDAPWPLQDRDVALHMYTIVDEASGVMEIKVQDAKNFIPETNGFVRMTKLNAHWKIVQSGPEEVEITYQVHVEPGGTVPPSVANGKAVGNPFETLLGIKKQLSEETVALVTPQ